MRSQWDEMTDVHPSGVNSPALCRMLFQSFRMRYMCVLAFHCANLTFGFALLCSVKASQQTFSKQVAQNLPWIIKLTCWTKSDRTSVQQLFWFLPVGRLVHQRGLHSSPWNHLEASQLYIRGKNFLFTWSALHPDSVFLNSLYLNSWTSHMVTGAVQEDMEYIAIL